MYTYARVDVQSNRVANYLIRHGIQKGDVVAIFAHRSVAIVYAIMGVLKAGATFTVIGAFVRPEHRPWSSEACTAPLTLNGVPGCHRHDWVWW